ncbi:MAG TPA: hypothetical protein VFP02_08945 [Acidimicrobiales bacterium]|nr:hypothetical protein [Acidimicrobiales bacterium]
MADLHMVHLASVDTPFEARVLVARLGAEGIVWELRGASDVYPVGQTHVWVDEASVGTARELLLTDAVEAVFDDDSDGGDGLGQA